MISIIITILENRMSITSKHSMNAISEYHKTALKYAENNDYNNAIEYYKKILDHPKCLSKYNYLLELVELYKKTGMFENMINECYIPLLKIEPYNGVWLNEVGICYFQLQKYRLAIQYFEKVIQIKELPDVYNNIGINYVKLKEYRNAEKIFLRSYAIDANTNAKNSLGELYYYLKEYDKSLYYYNQIYPQAPSHLYNLSFTYLAMQQFRRGYELYENRLASNDVNPQTKLQERVNIPILPYWDGVLPCKKLLVVYEQGLGDNIQHYRFMIELCKKHPQLKIEYFCKDTVSKVFVEYDRLKIVDKVELLKPNGEKNYDYYCYIMSLPKMVGVEKIYPNRVQYLKTNETKRLEWKTKLAHLKKYKVGFMYNGLLSSFIEKNIPLKEFKKLCNLDIDLICLHKKDELEPDLANISFADKIHRFDIDQGSPFEDTIHILQELDLVITIDTVLVHLAGVLNVKTWLLLGESEWRWSNQESSTYWYNSVELIRKTDGEKELKSVMPTVVAKLKKLLETEPESKTNIDTNDNHSKVEIPIIHSVTPSETANISGCEAVGDRENSGEQRSKEFESVENQTPKESINNKDPDYPLLFSASINTSINNVDENKKNLEKHPSKDFSKGFLLNDVIFKKSVSKKDTNNNNNTEEDTSSHVFISI